MVVDRKNLKPLTLLGFTLGPLPNAANSSNINLDVQRVHKSTDSMDIHVSVPGLLGESTCFTFFQL